MAETYKTYGTHSDTMVVICGRKQQDGSYANGVILIDNSGPTPIEVPVNWITQGYADGDLLDGRPDGSGPTLPSLTLTLTNGADFATVYQANVAVVCDALPYTIRSVAPTAPIFVADVPRVAGTHKATDIYQGLTGAATVIDQWDLKVE